ncbi:uncharacterized protein LOC133451255 [Cololabis saira]|uniref:uncharacterized protein LOC133451255 n=1 Tax=Cololabis saira TaxID=129043 RepID=UPI002AD4DE04|nr:uncharacterized protein LOC133451255 [Cololabis saira]
MGFLGQKCSIFAAQVASALWPSTIRPWEKKSSLSQGCRLAKRAGNTFRNGLVFSNRPVGIRERICLRVLENVHKWEGALRVGFTSLPPTDRNLPLPSMAIPDLTECPGHWAAPLPEFYCQAASRHSHFTTNLPRDRPEHNFPQDAMKLKSKPVPGTDMQHICRSRCLGPLAFHNQAVGEKIQLSQGCRLAKRAGNTFRNGLVFSNRPVGIRERICLRVLENVYRWEGVLRVGFTNLPPTDRNLPLPSMAIPDLTECPGHWAAPLPEFYCQAGSELEFWVSAGGSFHFSDKNKGEHKLLTGLDLSKPLWFMIDIYGQASSIFLLGSQKKGKLCTQKSCPAPGPESLTIPDNGYDHSWNPDVSSLSGHSEDSISSLNLNIPPGNKVFLLNDESSLLVTGESCVTCLTREATVTLPCAHKCLCHHCFPKVLQEFGTCPLCRTEINVSSVVEQRISV